MIDRKTTAGFCLGVAFAFAGALALNAGLALAQTGANQPHMQAALAALTTARAELAVAATNKAGHRVSALSHVNAAIAEVQAGMAAAE